MYFGASVTTARRLRLSSVGEMQIGNFPFDYLGVPLFRKVPNIHHLCLVADKILSQFEFWKGIYLSYAGRVCLDNSVSLLSLFILLVFITGMFLS